MNKLTLFGLIIVLGFFVDIDAMESQAERLKTPVSKQALQVVLRKAIKDGTSDAVKQAVQKGADINAQYGMFGQTPLLLALTLNKVQKAKRLLELGADANLCDGDDVSPLQFAADGGKKETVKLLLEYKAAYFEPVMNRLAASRSDHNARDGARLVIEMQDHVLRGKKDIDIDAKKKLILLAEKLADSKFSKWIARDNTKCPACFNVVSYDDHTFAYKECFHVLCSECKTQWNKESRLCPLCRKGDELKLSPSCSKALSGLLNSATFDGDKQADDMFKACLNTFSTQDRGEVLERVMHRASVDRFLGNMFS